MLDDFLEELTARREINATNASTDWSAWHEQYADPTSQLGERLGWFRDHDFEEEAFVAPDHALYAVGCSVYRRPAGCRHLLASSLV